MDDPKTQSKDSPSMVIATYNIHRCVGRDGICDPGRTLAVLKALNAQLIALQEVESYKTGGRDLLEYFAAETGLQAIAGPTMFNGKVHYGNAVLTSATIQEVKHLDLTVHYFEPRGALCLDLFYQGHAIHVQATHLGLSPRERRLQVRRLLREIETTSAPVKILLGDLNEWFLWGRPIRWLHRHFSTPEAPATFPARYPVFSLDRIWAEPSLCINNVQSLNNGLTRMASDHLPLRAEIRPV